MLPLELLGFATLACGCLVGRYRPHDLTRAIEIVEEKGHRCTCRGHRLNEPL